jgi:pimeloyl-ACP methyl ester carboxylesterase
VEPMQIVFVHGACVVDGAWWWSRVADLLPMPSVSVELPSCGEGDAASDVEALQSLLQGSGPSIVVAHSYGGVVASAASLSGDVRHLVFIDSFLPDAGESLATFTGPELAPYLQMREDGAFTVRKEVVSDLFLHDCDDAAASEAVQRLAWQDSSVLSTPVAAAAWRSIPSTYVVCADDRATPPELQRAQAGRAGRVVEIPTGHHPMLSRPDLIAGLL